MLRTSVAKGETNAAFSPTSKHACNRPNHCMHTVKANMAEQGQSRGTPLKTFNMGMHMWATHALSVQLWMLLIPS